MLGPGTLGQVPLPRLSDSPRDREKRYRIMQVFNVSLCLCVVPEHTSTARLKAERAYSSDFDASTRVGCAYQCLSVLSQEGSAVLATLAAALVNSAHCCTNTATHSLDPLITLVSGRDAITRLLFYLYSASHPRPSPHLHRQQPRRHCCTRCLHPNAVPSTAPSTLVRQRRKTQAKTWSMHTILRLDPPPLSLRITEHATSSSAPSPEVRVCEDCSAA